MSIVFTNVGSTACLVTGYPAVDGVNTAGVTVAHAAWTINGYTGGVAFGKKVPRVVLAAGAVAAADTEATDVDPDSCQGFVTLRVTPPGSHVATTIPAHVECEDFEVHPVLRGRTGQEFAS